MSTSKIPVASITFTFSENENLSKQSFETWAGADSAVVLASFSAPAGGAYDKTYYTVRWADGREDTGRFDLVRESRSLSAEVRSSLQLYTGERRPPHWSEGKYAAFLTERAEHVSAAKALLDGYELP